MTPSHTLGRVLTNDWDTQNRLFQFQEGAWNGIERESVLQEIADGAEEGFMVTPARSIQDTVKQKQDPLMAALDAPCIGCSWDKELDPQQIRDWEALQEKEIIMPKEFWP